MRERGIAYSAPMVLARRAGLKTQTRRLVRWPSWADPERDGEEMRKHLGLAYCVDGRPVKRFTCPYGVPGDRLYVRETWYDDNALRSREQAPTKPDDYIYYRADGEAREQLEQLDPPNARIWHPSIHMPRWASRGLDEITDVRVQRVQDISEEDAIAEGINIHGFQGSTDGISGREHRIEYATLWDQIYGKRAPLASNPWVWCLTFKVIE